MPVSDAARDTRPSFSTVALPTSGRRIASERPCSVFRERRRRLQTMQTFRPLAALALGLTMASAGTAALAETTVTRSETAASGKSVRLVLAPNLKKDCAVGPMPEFRIVTAPKNGSIVTKTGKTKTPASYRCPNKEAAVQALFYQSKAGFTGSDEVTVEVKNADGAVQTQNIRLTVEAGSGKKDDAKKDSTDL